jgi:hypothetical protein
MPVIVIAAVASVPSGRLSRMPQSAARERAPRQGQTAEL